MEDFTRIFAKFGYQIIFIGAFLEAALLIDFLVPGGSVVLAGAYFASQGVLSYPVFLLVSAAGFILGFLLDYLIGFYGWSDILRRFGLGEQLDKIEEKIHRLGGKAFFVGYIHPDLASLFAVAAGIIKMPIRYFILYNFLAGFLWLLIWTGAVYIFGTQFSELFEDHRFLGVLLIPLIVVVFTILKKI